MSEKGLGKVRFLDFKILGANASRIFTSQNSSLSSVSFNLVVLAYHTPGSPHSVFGLLLHWEGATGLCRREGGL